MQAELDELRQYLTQRQVTFTESDVQHGKKLVVSTGEQFLHYPKKNKVVVQGDTSTSLSRDVSNWLRSASSPTYVPAEQATPMSEVSGLKNDVFVVYGHDMQVRKDLELLLHQMGMKPIVLADLPACGDTIIEKLEQYLDAKSDVGFACVLLTPDDEGHPKGDESAKKYRARQNVILELGMVLARLGRKRVAILHKGSIELPSDISGLIYLPFEEEIREVSEKLRKELSAAGYKPSF